MIALRAEDPMVTNRVLIVRLEEKMARVLVKKEVLVHHLE
jgi:hypothetical protein